MENDTKNLTETVQDTAEAVLTVKEVSILPDEKNAAFSETTNIPTDRMKTSPISEDERDDGQHRLIDLPMLQRSLLHAIEALSRGDAAADPIVLEGDAGSGPSAFTLEDSNGFNRDKEHNKCEEGKKEDLGDRKLDLECARPNHVEEDLKRLLEEIRNVDFGNGGSAEACEVEIAQMCGAGDLRNKEMIDLREERNGLDLTECVCLGGGAMSEFSYDSSGDEPESRHDESEEEVTVVEPTYDASDRKKMESNSVSREDIVICVSDAKSRDSDGEQVVEGDQIEECDVGDDNTHASLKTIHNISFNKHYEADGIMSVDILSKKMRVESNCPHEKNDEMDNDDEDACYNYKNTDFSESLIKENEMISHSKFLEVFRSNEREESGTSFQGKVKLMQCLEMEEKNNKASYKDEKTSEPSEEPIGNINNENKMQPIGKSKEIDSMEDEKGARGTPASIGSCFKFPPKYKKNDVSKREEDLPTQQGAIAEYHESIFAKKLNYEQIFIEAVYSKDCDQQDTEFHYDYLKSEEEKILKNPCGLKKYDVPDIKLRGEMCPYKRKCDLQEHRLALNLPPKNKLKSILNPEDSDAHKEKLNNDLTESEEVLFQKLPFDYNKGEDAEKRYDEMAINCERRSEESHKTTVDSFSKYNESQLIDIPKIGENDECQEDEETIVFEDMEMKYKVLKEINISKLSRSKENLTTKINEAQDKICEQISRPFNNNKMDLHVHDTNLENNCINHECIEILNFPSEKQKCFYRRRKEYYVPLNEEIKTSFHKHDDVQNQICEKTLLKKNLQGDNSNMAKTEVQAYCTTDESEISIICPSEFDKVIDEKRTDDGKYEKNELSINSIKKESYEVSIVTPKEDTKLDLKIPDRQNQICESDEEIEKRLKVNPLENYSSANYAINRKKSANLRGAGVASNYNGPEIINDHPQKFERVLSKARGLSVREPLVCEESASKIESGEVVSGKESRSHRLIDKSNGKTCTIGNKFPKTRKGESRSSNANKIKYDNSKEKGETDKRETGKKFGIRMKKLIFSAFGIQSRTKR